MKFSEEHKREITDILATLGYEYNIVARGISVYDLNIIKPDGNPRRVAIISPSKKADISEIRSLNKDISNGIVIGDFKHNDIEGLKRGLERATKYLMKDKKIKKIKSDKKKVKKVKKNRKWTQYERQCLFEIMGKLKRERGITEYENTKQWSEDCSKCAEILSQEFGEKIRRGQVEGQVFSIESSKYSRRTAENFAYGILGGYISLDRLKSMINKE